VLTNMQCKGECAYSFSQTLAGIENITFMLPQLRQISKYPLGNVVLTVGEGINILSIIGIWPFGFLYDAVATLTFQPIMCCSISFHNDHHFDYSVFLLLGIVHQGAFTWFEEILDYRMSNSTEHSLLNWHCVTYYFYIM